MRFLLINVPIRLDSLPNNFPTGLGIIAQTLLNHGHEVQILDANVNRYSQDQVLSIAQKSNADAIGISGLISTYKYQNWLINILKEKLPHTPIIVGGGCSTCAPDLMMKHTKADILVLGEGEHTIVEIAKTLEQRDPLESVQGIVFRTNDKIVKTPKRPLEQNLDNFPLPAYDLFPTELYIKNPFWGQKKRSMNLVSSRGCPMDCHFCYNLFGHRSYRRRGVESITTEVRFLKNKYDVEFFGFVDDNLTINKKHLKAVCDALKPEKIEWGCHGRVDTLDDDRLTWMRDSGCKWLGFGIESGSPKILALMNKKATVQQAKEAILKTREYGIFANTTFIYGYPGEDEETIRETMRFKIDLDLYCNGFFATPYPGTNLYEYARKKELIQDEHAYLLSLNNAYDFVLNLTDMPDDKFLLLRKLSFKEIATALLYKLLVPSKDKEEKTKVMLMIDFLLTQPCFLPEVKGHVLLGSAQYFEAHGDFDLASKTRSFAAKYFKAPQQKSAPPQAINQLAI